MKDLCIVVPIYHNDLRPSERYSLGTLKEKCPEKYDIIVIHPKSLKVDVDLKASYIAFDDKYFKDTDGYSELLKTTNFYKTFKSYKYILIFQTDCIALSFDKMPDWIAEDFDYVGSPIISNKNHWPSAPVAGNGGLSLRKVKKFIELTSNKKLIKELNKKETYRKYEDAFFIEGMSQHYYIDIPVWEEAASFSFDMNPDIIFKQLNILPEIGIHAFGKNIPFWKDKLNIPKEVIDESMEKYKVFISIYYKDKQNETTI